MRRARALGLVLSFTGVDEQELETGVRRMAELRPLCEAARSKA